MLTNCSSSDYWILPETFTKAAQIFRNLTPPAALQHAFASRNHSTATSTTFSAMYISCSTSGS